MDPLENPYSMGAGNPPPALSGRESQSRQFEILIGRLSRGRGEQSMLVWGLRGVGKTVLLLEFRRIALAEGWVAGEPIEIKSETNIREEIAEQAYEALLLLDRRRALGEKFKRLVGVLQGFRLATTDGGGVEFSFDPSAVSRSATGDLERDLAELFTQLGEVAKEQETGVVFLIGEMQFLAKNEMEAVAAAMHRMAQRQLPVALAGTGLPQLPGLMVEAKSYAERLFAYPRLDRLSEDAAKEALVLPAQEQDVEYEGEALARILELSARYPAFLQAYGKQVWITAPRSPITSEDVAASEPLVQDKLDAEFFHTRFERATPTERRYMSAMALLGDGPQASSAIAEKLGYKKASGASIHRDALIKKGLIYAPDHGLLDFTVPQFAAFMRRRYPLDA